MYGLYCAISGSEHSSVALLNRQRKLEYNAAISKICTRSLFSIVESESARVAMCSPVRMFASTDFIDTTEFSLPFY